VRVTKLIDIPGRFYSTACIGEGDSTSSSTDLNEASVSSGGSSRWNWVLLESMGSGFPRGGRLFEKKYGDIKERV